MEIRHDFRPAGGAAPAGARLDQLEAQHALCRKALGHDLPNQLASLQGLARLLGEELGDGLAPDLRALVDRLATLARQADQRVRALADLGRLWDRPGPPEALELGELAREAAAEAKLLLGVSDVELHFPARPLPLTAARAPLYQVLTHLLRNALRAAAPDRPLRVEVGARRDAAGFVELSVADNGSGMTEPQLRQAGATLAGQPRDSAGLGFLVVRQVVAGWEGAVRVRSEPGQGTTVIVLARTLGMS